MATRPELVVTLDGRVHPADAALVGADDPLFSRGDGVFETLLVRSGAPCLLDAHLLRLARSAAIVGLPTPDATAWRRAAGVAAQSWGAAEEGVLRLVLGRGRTGATVAFATVSAVPDRVPVARRDGVSVSAVTRRVADGPWSSVRAKSSSYAVSSAALREAARAGADDAVFVDTHGVVLEGPRSSVVVVADGVLRTPATELPILRGTTVDALFGEARRRGITCQWSTMTLADLIAAQSVWLLSAVTLAARVHTLDGAALPAGDAGVQVSRLVDLAVADRPLGVADRPLG